MLITISPSKTINFETLEKDIFLKSKPPQFLEKTLILSEIMKTKSSYDLQKLMKISPKLGDLNFERFQNFNKDFEINKNAKPALWTFTGDVYRGFNLENFTTEDISFAEENLKIISGFYGLISPLTLIKPYRLEMGTRLNFDTNNKTYKNLYAYWQEILTDELNKNLENKSCWLNLASVEYSKVFDRKKISKKILDVDFKIEKNGVAKIIAIFAKRQRGELSNWIIQNKITKISDLKNYQNDGFTFNPKNSSENKITFLKK